MLLIMYVLLTRLSVVGMEGVDVEKVDVEVGVDNDVASCRSLLLEDN